MRTTGIKENIEKNIFLNNNLVVTYISVRLFGRWTGNNMIFGWPQANLNYCVSRRGELKSAKRVNKK